VQAPPASAPPPQQVAPKQPTGWDWVLAQYRGIQPVYVAVAVILGILAVVLTYFFARSTPEEGALASGGRARSGGGPVIGDLEQSGGSIRVQPATPPRPASEEDVPWKPRKPRPDDGGNA
jgi:hypothetical protein